MKIINLTPHDINVVLENGEVVTYPKSGNLARVAVDTEITHQLEDGTPIMRSIYGEVQGLPEPTPETLLIVSGLVKSAAEDRDDLVSPGVPVRDADGRVIGCKGLSY